MKYYSVYHRDTNRFCSKRGWRYDYDFHPLSKDVFLYGSIQTAKSAITRAAKRAKSYRSDDECIRFILGLEIIEINVVPELDETKSCYRALFGVDKI